MSAAPSSVRWHILALLMALCFISHFNRVSMSVAGNDRIMPDYGIEPTRMGAIYSSFLLIYSICMLPGGVFIDRFGPRRALMVVGFGSAVFGALTGLTGWLFPSAAGLWVALLGVRGSMGMLSAPLHPASARAAGLWFPPAQRSLANGLITGAAIIGVATAYPGFGALIRNVGWETAFVGAATATVLLTVAWTAYAADLPARHPRVNAAEALLIGGDAASEEGTKTSARSVEGGGPASARTRVESLPGGGWRELLLNRSLLLVTLSYAAVGYFQYLFVYWMQYYFDKVLHLGESTSKLYASIPQVAMALAMPLGGWLADRLAQKTGVRRGRSLVSGVGMLASGALLGLGVLAKDPVSIVTWFTLALGAIGASEGPFWATAVDIGGRAGGTAAAICNTGGNLGGLLAPVITPWVSERWGWQAGISLGGLICFLGALCWCGIDPHPAGRDSHPVRPPS